MGFVNPPTTATPSGAAGGLLSGTYPNPGLALGQLQTVGGGNVALATTASFTDIVSIAQGSTGTWWVSGTITILSGAAADVYRVKLWDGTTVISSGETQTAAANAVITITLSGYLPTPAGNIKISVQPVARTDGSVIFNGSTASKDIALFAFRIA